MAAPNTVTLYLPKHAVEALLALGTLKIMLAGDSYTPNQDTLDFINDVTDEAAGAGYVAGGVAVDNPVVTLDTTANTATIFADDWLPVGLSVVCRWAAVYVDTGNPATSPVLNYLDLSEGLGGEVTCTGILWDANGIVPFAVAA